MKKLTVFIFLLFTVKGMSISYFLNYSGKEQSIMYSFNKGNELLTGKTFKKGDPILLKTWDVVIE